MIKIPQNYTNLLDTKQTEQAIKFVKDTFERQLSSELKLSRVTSTLFVPTGSGINDDLNGIERPVSFEIKNMNNKKMEVVHSLAKWKRMTLADQHFKAGYGLYTDMDAIRPDDDIDNIHSIYVDQWDWELVIEEKDYNLDFLKKTVSKIYEALKRTAFLVEEQYPACNNYLPENITFIDSEKLREQYPNLTPPEREREAAREFGAVFVIGIGWPLADSVKHGGRAPDYDNWSLNGDLIVWNSVLEDSLELSSMGIRVNKQAMLKQLEFSGNMERTKLYWHKRLLNGEFPLSIGGGIGQSRICMYLLHKAHIGEVQASAWPQEDIDLAAKHNIILM